MPFKKCSTYTFPKNCGRTKAPSSITKRSKSLFGSMVLNSTPPKRRKIECGLALEPYQEGNMFKSFSANSTRTYLPVLTELVHQYNSTKHSFTKMTPIAAVKKKMRLKCTWNLYRYLPPMQKPRFRVGDNVLITKKNMKGYIVTFNS